MVTEKKAHVDDSAGNMMPPSTQSTLLSLLAKLVDKDPNYRRSSMEAIKELMQREVHEHNDMSPFIDTLLGTLDKKSKHYLVPSADQSSYSHLVQASTFLLAEMAKHATQQHFKIGLHHIASIVKHLVSWFRLDKGGSQSLSLHQACAKLVCSLAENAALMNDEDAHSKSSLHASDSSTLNHENSELNDFSSSSSCSNEDPFEQVNFGMESLICRPLIAALCSKVEPTSRGATICLEALVSQDSLRFASLSLTEELCFKAVNAMQERTALSASTAQMSLLCNLAKKNHESLSCFRAGLLKKGVDILLNGGAWQQRVAAARLIECVLSMGGLTCMRSEHDKQAALQAIESLEQCRLDKVAMVRSAVSEALKKAKEQQGLDKGNALSPPALNSMAPTSSLSPMDPTKVDYRKRRRKKPSCGPNERQPAFSSLPLIRSDPFYGNDRWVNKVTPSSGWSSSDSVNSSIDVKCPRKKVAKIGAWNGKTGSTIKKNEQASLLWSPSSSSSSLSTPKTTAAPSSALRMSCNTTDEMNRNPSSHPCDEETTKYGSPMPHKLMNSLILEPVLSHKLEKGGMEESISSCSSFEDDVCSTHTANATNYACGTEQECNCATPTYIHHNPIAQFESLEEVEGHDQVCKSAPNNSGDFLSTTPISLLLSNLEKVQLQHTVVADGMKRKEPVNDSAWNVRNNPIATDDSELDSPRPTVFDNYSIVYCDDGDDNDGVNAQERQPDCDGDSLPHGRQHQEGDDFADERNGGVDIAKKRSHEGQDQCVCSFKNNFASLPSKNDAEASSAEYQAKVLVSKAMVMEGGESQKHEVMCAEHDVRVCKSVPKRCCDASHCLLQDISAEKCSSLKEQELLLSRSYSNVLTQDGGNGHAAVIEVANQNEHTNNQLEHCIHADCYPHVAINEHEVVGDNFDEFACLNVTHQALCNEATWESATVERPYRGHELKGIITHAEDVQALSKPAIAMEALQAGSLQKRFAGGEDDDSRRDAEEENGNSVLGWLTNCYVVKKLGAFGALCLALTIPLAIVSIIVTFDTKEEASDFLVPT